MKRIIILIVVISVFALTGFYFSKTGVSVTTEAQRSPGLSPIKSANAKSPAKANQNVPAIALDKTAVAKTEKIPPAFDDFALWAQRFQKSSANVVEGEKLAWRRREAMLDLIQTDPAEALALAAPFDWRQNLPPEVTRFFEEQVDGRGDFSVMIGTDFTQGISTVMRNVQIAGKSYQAFTSGRRSSQPTKSGIPLHGIALAGKMAVDVSAIRVLTLEEATAVAKSRGQPLDPICGVSGQPATSRNQPVYADNGGTLCCFCGVDHYNLVKQQWALAESGRTAASGDGTTLSGNSITDDNWTHGPKTVLYMRVNFPDDLTEPISEDDAYATMTQVNIFYVTNSYNLTSLDTTVAPLVTLPQTKAYYSLDPGLLLTDARAATKAAGYDTANYDRDIVVFTSVPGYTFGGLAFVGGKGVWLQSFGAGVTAHELGHNYGLWHANFWNAITNASGIAAGTNLEYGNSFDTMGAANAGIYLFNAAHKNVLDWLKTDSVQLINSNGIYRIYPMDAPPRVQGRYYAGVVRKDALRNYWLEFRDKFTSNPWLENGVLLNWAPWDQSDGGTSMIDTTPGSPNISDLFSREDSAVVVGRTFNDNPGGVHITTIARGATGTDPWLDVQVNLGGFPGNNAPVLKVEVDQTNVAPGVLVHFHATATDPDGDALAYSWTFDDLTFSTNNLPWVSKSWAAAGDHVVRCVVSDMKGGEASVNALVTVGSPGGVRISGRVTDLNGEPLEGVLVSNGSNTLASFIGGYTDSDGRYVIANVSDSLTLNAVQYGYVLTNITNWSGPLSGASNVVNADFIGTPLPTVSVAADTNAIPETDGSAHSFTVTRTGAITNDLTLQVRVSGSATPGANYNLSPSIGTNVTIPASNNSVSFTLQAIHNPLVQGPETVTVTLLDDTNFVTPAYALASLAEATITILDTDQPVKPVITVATTTAEIAENGMDNGQFVFSRTGSTQNDLLVFYSIGGTGQPGTDYVPLAGVAVIPAGQSSAIVPLQPVDNHAVQSNQTVSVTIGANSAYTAGSPNSATILILNDDAAMVTVMPTKEPAVVSSVPGVFTIKRDGDLTDALVVTYSASGTAVAGVNYVPLSGTVTIPAGAASANVTLTPTDDGIFELDKTVTLVLTNDYNYDVGIPGSATISITQGEKPTVSISAPVSSVSEQGDNFGKFLISRDTTAGDLSVYLSVSGTAMSGIDYLPLDNPTVIPNGSSSVTLNVIPFHDLILEPTETVIVNLLANTNYNIGTQDNATVKILDDATTSTPGVGFCFATSAFPENQSPGIAVGLSMTSTVPVMVDYRVIGGTAPGSRYQLAQGTLTIPATNWVAFVPLHIVNDTVVEPPQTVQVVLFNPVNATLDGIKVHTYTILDDDLASVSVTATAPNAFETGHVPGNFRITRTGSTNASQLVNFQLTGTASAPTDFAPLGTSAVIPAGAAFVDLPVTPVDDHTTELTQTVVMTLISAPGGAIISPNAATVTISDNDSNTLPLVTVTSTNHPYAVEGGSNGEFLFTRTGATNSALTISYAVTGTAAAGVRYTSLGTSITIPAGQTFVSLPVAAINDTAVEGEQTVILSLTAGTTYRVADPSAATVTIQDNDQTVWIDASDFAASKYKLDPGQFTFTRFGTTNTPATVNYVISGTAVNGVDYVAITNSIVIPAGQLSVTLPILPVINFIVKGPVTVTLTLQASGAYHLGTPLSGTVTIDDNMPMVVITSVVPEVLEGSGSNGVFRITRTGDPQFDFTAHLKVTGTATYGVDYPPFATNVYFSCGVTSIDLFVAATNELVVEGDETVNAALLPDPTYTILSPSNAVITIHDAGTNQTPLVTITSPINSIAYLIGTNVGLVIHATVTDDSPSNTLTWTNISGPNSFILSSTNTSDTTVYFTNYGVYVMRLTADDGQLQGFADVTVIVAADLLTGSNTLHWPFDEGFGTNVADVSGGSNNGALFGGPAWITNGVLGDALNFPGSNSCVRQTSGTNLLDGSKQFTLAMWIKPATTNLDGGFFTANDTGTNQPLELAARSVASCGNYTNVIELIMPTTQGVVKRVSASNVIKPFQWQHVAVTWSNGLAPSVYINGHLDQPMSGMVAAEGRLTNCPQFIAGKGFTDSANSWNGGIDDVRFYPRALSAGEVLALAGFPVTNHAPVVYAGGPTITVQVNLPFTLAGTVTDDGLPIPPGAFTTTWSSIGSNIVAIPDPTSLANTFVFTDPSNYVFQLTADDGQVQSFDLVTVMAIEPTRVDVFADIGDAYELGPVPGEFTLFRDGATNELTVYLAVTGTASNGVDYIPLATNVTFATGSNSVTLPVMPFLDYAIEGDESVTLSIVTNIAYFVGNGQATVTIHDSPYGLWSIQHFTLEQLTHPELTGPGADFDHDSIPNFAEYAFNTDPLATNNNPPFTWDFETDPDDGLQHFTLTYTRRLPPRDVEYGVFVSTDLQTWNTGEDYVEEFSTSPDANGITETVKVRALLPYPATSNLFMNIRVWLQQVPQ